MNPLLQEIYSTIVPSAPYIIAAYALVWAVLMVWLFVQFGKQNKLARQVALLEEELEDAKKAGLPGAAGAAADAGAAGAGDTEETPGRI